LRATNDGLVRNAVDHPELDGPRLILEEDSERRCGALLLSDSRQCSIRIGRCFGIDHCDVESVGSKLPADAGESLGDRRSRGIGAHQNDEGRFRGRPSASGDQQEKCEKNGHRPQARSHHGVEAIARAVDA
jgi:hypothetical protein